MQSGIYHTFYTIFRSQFVFIFNFFEYFDFIWIIYHPSYQSLRQITKFSSLLCVAAQITQWGLIFYGTETPAQPDDQEHPHNPNQFTMYGNEVARNDIEYDSTGQWRNMQQVSVASILHPVWNRGLPNLLPV